MTLEARQNNMKVFKTVYKDYNMDRYKGNNMIDIFNLQLYHRGDVTD